MLNVTQKAELSCKEMRLSRSHISVEVGAIGMIPGASHHQRKASLTQIAQADAMFCS